jgi:hypothetical protein
MRCCKALAATGNLVLQPHSDDCLAAQKAVRHAAMVL